MFRAEFRRLDETLPIRVYRRHLPHWRQQGVTYFVTMRLADSIPRSVVERWTREREGWFAANGLSRDLSDEEWFLRYRQIPEHIRREFERRQARQLFTELDRCHGACWLARPPAAAILADAMRFHHGTRLHTGPLVAMPNHAHWLVTPAAGENLEKLTQSVKRFAAVRINRYVRRSGRFWQTEDYDHIVRGMEELERIGRYIRENPSRARLRKGQYLYVPGEPYV